MGKSVLIKPHNTLLIRLALGVLCFAALATAAPYRKTKSTLYLDTKDTLQIEFDRLVDLEIDINYPEQAEDMKRDGHRLFIEAFVPIFETSNFPMDYVFLDYRKRAKKGNPILRIQAIRWKQDEFTGQIELIVQAELRGYSLKQKVGSYRGREPVSMGGSIEARERVERKLISKTLSPLIYDLMKHFDEVPEMLRPR